LGLIITELKPLDQIIDMIQPHEKIFIVGCGGCATICQTGGKDQVKDMAERVREVKDVVGTVVVEQPCDERLVKRDLNKHFKDKQPDAVLVMACGVGSQVLSETYNVICVPALDTKFIGKVERIGRFFERCKACGECILYDAGGICPITRCAKGLLNGPCGGQSNGKCEVGGWKNDCAWVLIYDRLKKLGQLDKFKKCREAKDHKLKAGPTELIWRGER